ncbi:MAG TPA: complex I subunit 1 family protein [Anaeromyxobacteraceae bacterium]|nr:complex I subunit 1 family protein [Anaeromyxobacteraceae bacterium]
MKRFVGMWLVIGAVLVGMVLLFQGFYLLAGLGAVVAARLGAPPFYGSAIANTITLMAVLLMTVAALLTVAERKWSAAMQDRIGANRIRVFGTALGGVPYLLADALKMLTKEATYPAARSRLLFELAPVMAFAPTFALFAVVPVGPELEVFGQKVALVVANPDVGLLWIFALAGLSVYGTTLAGWASNNRAGLLGGVRAASQMISYEVSLGMSLVGVMLAYRTINLSDMVLLQGNAVLGPVPALGVLLQPLGFLVFFTSSFAETKRAPFDLPEGESEIVGYFVEYSGMKFGMMFLAEFMEVVILAGVVTAVFLGGWHPVIFEGWLRANLPPMLFAGVCAASFLVKVILLCWLQLIIRWLLPRFRFDQIQALCWKMLLPGALLNLFVTGAAVLLDPSLQLLAWIGVAEIVAIFGVTAAAARTPEASQHGHDQGHAAHAAGH